MMIIIKFAIENIEKEQLGNLGLSPHPLQLLLLLQKVEN